MKLHLFLLAGLLLSGSVSAEPEATKPETYTGWRLAPDAEAKLAEFSAGSAGCRLKDNRTEFIPRAQLKYTLSKDDYLHRWYDRPLYQDTALARFTRKREEINDPEARALKAACERAKLWGVASLLHTSGRISFFKTSLDNQLKLYCELGVRRKPESIREDYFRIAEMSLQAPNVYRFNGRPVISFYPAETRTDYIRNIREALQAKVGDRIALVPYVPFFDKHKFKRSKGPLTAADIEAMAEDLRAHLRIADGILITSLPLVFRGKTDNSFGFEVMIPILHKIYSEPEFKEKFLAYDMNQGHENQYRWTRGRNSEGVRALRKELEFVAGLRPDVCLLTEWDEVNENTCYRPMANTGWSSLRLVRHFVEKVRGEKFTAFPGDDLSVPNMIFAYRRRLLAGETAEYQITNVPDQTPEREYRVTLTLTDVKGNVIRQFEPKTLRSAECAEVSFKIPAAELLSHQLVKPRLEVAWDGGKYVSPDSFWAQELRADRNPEWQWAKQPLREQLSGVKAEYTVTPYENGLLRLKGTITSPVPMAQAEILDGCDTVWMADKRPALRETDEEAVIQAEFHGLTRFDFQMTLDAENAPGARIGRGEGPSRTFKEKQWNSNFSRAYLVRLPKKEIGNAVLHIRVPECFDERVPVREIMEKQVMGFYTPKNGLHMVLTRYNSQFRIPEHIDAKEASFDCFVLPCDVKKSVFSIRVIDPQGNTWRGAEKSLYTPSGTVRKFHVYDKASGQGVEIAADENLLTPMTFDFAPGRGTVVPCPAGRQYRGIMNGCTPLASGMGFGGSRYGSLMFDALRNGGKYPELPRRIREEDGGWSLEFDKCSYLSLPMQVVPMYAGYKIAMKIWVPDHSPREQFIFGSGSHGFMLAAVNGKLRAQMFLGVRFDTTGSGIVSAESAGKLIPGKWNEVSVVYDQKTFTVHLNGEPGAPVEATGSQMRPKAGILGGGESLKTYFTGRIKDLSVEVF